MEKYKPACSRFVCDNAKLREFIASKIAPDAAQAYERNIRNIREASLSEEKGMVLKREEMKTPDQATTMVNNTVVVLLVIVAIAVLVGVVRRRRKKMEK